MDIFRTELQKYNVKDNNERIQVFVPYDQLSDELGMLARYPPERLTLIFVETLWKARRRPYHKQKLCLILSNMRHFAIEQAKRGANIHYVTSTESYGTVLASLCSPENKIYVMRPAERELRADIAHLVHQGAIQIEEHDGWMSSQQDFRRSNPKKPWRLDRFYQYMRKKSGVLMENGTPKGGKYSFDSENREPWKGEPYAAIPPSFPSNPIKEEVVSFISTTLSYHPGELHPESIPSTKEDASLLWDWAKIDCMHHFGSFEDAMSTLSTNLFHTRVSALLHLHRLLPKNLVEEVEAMDIPLNSKEGFIRQVLGWREFVYRVHEETDGFRLGQERAEVPSDGGYAYWRQLQGDSSSWVSSVGGDGGSLVNELGYAQPIPPAFWGMTSGLNCLDSVVKNVWDESYAHHIPRLMVLANIATLLEIRPQDITAWFWVAFYDAFDWVVEPNVLAMGTFATGELCTTKPYIAGAGYIHKMSNFCDGCAFSPQKNCPITNLYWAFLDRHQEVFQKNFRMKMILASSSKRQKEKKEQDAKIYQKMCAILAQGGVLTPDSWG